MLLLRWSNAVCKLVFNDTWFSRTVQIFLMQVVFVFYVDFNTFAIPCVCIFF